MKRKTILQIILHAALILLVVASLLPFLNMISVSLMPNSYILPSTPQLLPKQLFFGNYATAWREADFSKYFLNSLTISIANTFLSLLIGTLSGYGFARLSFPGKKLLFNLYVFSLMMPAILALVSQFTVLQKLHLVDTYTGLLMLYVSGSIAGNTFFLKGYFETIPRELEESVIIDGGGKWTIYRKIMLPLSRPALGILGIGAFTGTWMELFTALTVIKSESKRTLPIAIKLLQNGKATQWGLIFAASVIVLIPIILIFIVFNKQFMQRSGSEGAVKG